MSLKLHFASLSMGASVDQQTGSLSVFDVVEEIRVPQVPVHLQTLVISLALEKKVPEAFEGRMLIHLLTPDTKQHMVGSGELNVPADQRRMRALFRFGGFPLQQFGLHRFVLSWVTSANVKIGEAILDFDVIQSAQVAQGVAPADKPPVQH
jgi:hypothetical protein